MHGDEADSHRRRNFSVLTVSSLACHGPLFDYKFLVYCLDNSVATTDTASMLERYVAHSLAELQTETHGVGQMHQRIEKGSLRVDIGSFWPISKETRNGFKERSNL